uniref:uncharacterized protein LOC101308982 n=1 Tax=Fragaria vesca subsp. vesca TaxID=101020 RepID=UPI0005CA19F8|nr:PREDICTED: uncharacterized protein LOC101308982 [Fragaria vesca subsp. vesca]
MGAGRKTETYYLPYNQYPGYYEVPARNLTKNKLGAVIFGCKHSTMNECLSKQLFGLPAPHFVYVRNVTPGLPLFLFNYSDRKLYGIFEATSHGQMNIDPNGWTADGSGRTKFPAQVRVCVRMECPPLLESRYKPILAENYSNSLQFQFELDHEQTGKLLSLLAPLAISRGQPTQHNTLMWETDFRGLPSCSTIQKAELCKPPTSEAENPTPVPNWETNFPALPSQNTIQKVESLKPPTSEAENLTSVTTVKWETEFPALPQRKRMQKKAVSCRASTSATSTPQNRAELETDLPPLPSISTKEEPEWAYQLTSDVKHMNSSSLKGDATSSTPQNTAKWQADFPDFPSHNSTQEPEWLEALISEAEHTYRSSPQLDSIPLFGTFSPFQADAKKAEQEDLQLIYTKLKKINLQHSLHSKCQNIPLAGDFADSRAGSPYSQSDQKSGESPCYFSAQSPGSMFYPWVIAELLQEVQELKAFRTAQTEKISYLEDKLVQVQFEIKQLKDFIIDGA